MGYVREGHVHERCSVINNQARSWRRIGSKAREHQRRNRFIHRWVSSWNRLFQERLEAIGTRCNSWPRIWASVSDGQIELEAVNLGPRDNVQGKWRIKELPRRANKITGSLT